jgi:hypothetical protein
MRTQRTSARPQSQQRFSTEKFKRAIDRRDRHAVRAIGQRLHTLGGIPLMTKVLWRVSNDDHRTIHWVSTMWEGVGGQWYR